MQEIFKTVVDYEKYEISNIGNVRNKKSKVFLKPEITRFGYLRTSLVNDGVKRKHEFIHRLVASTFLENPENKPNVDHIDNNPLNNNFTNLRWCNQQENTRNKRIQKNIINGIKGVSFSKQRKKWIAHICINNVRYNLGGFVKIEVAVEARRKKSKELFGEFLNECEK